MAVRKRYRLWTGDSDDLESAVIELEDLRKVTGLISLDVVDRGAVDPDSSNREFVTVATHLSEDQARQLVAILRRMLGEISGAQLEEMLDD
jgi:hypothetical protein